MFFKINTSNGVPVYEQVSRQIMYAVAAGAYETGEMIPSVREFARELAINPNTVARAYRNLQSRSIIETVRGTGLAVSKGAKTKCVSARTRLVRDRLREVLQDARQSQLTDEEIQAIVTAELQHSQKRKS